MHELLLLVLMFIISVPSSLATSYCTPVLNGHCNVEKYVRNYFTANPPDEQSNPFAFKHKSEYVSRTLKGSSRKISIPRSRTDAFDIKVEFIDESTTYNVHVLFYVPPHEDMFGHKPYKENERKWILEIPKEKQRSPSKRPTQPYKLIYKKQIPSYANIREHYEKTLGHKYIVALQGGTSWVMADSEASIQPQPTKTVEFIGCFWFSLFEQFDAKQSETTDQSRVNGDYMKPLRFIRAFAGKPSIYVKKSALIATYKPHAPKSGLSDLEKTNKPWLGWDYTKLIAEIKNYPLKTLKTEINNKQWKEIQKIQRDSGYATVTLSGYNKKNIGPLMEYLWFGSGMSGAGKNAVTTYQNLWQKIFWHILGRTKKNGKPKLKGGRHFLPRSNIKLSKMLSELNRRYKKMIMQKPISGWNSICQAKKSVARGEYLDVMNELGEEEYYDKHDYDDVVGMIYEKAEQDLRRAENEFEMAKQIQQEMSEISTKK
eukprot:416347_1